MTPAKTRTAIGIFGGSFDPPHKIHITMAERAREFLGLDLVVFVPACSSPPKFGKHFAPFRDRVEMLKIALGNFSGKFEICEIEARTKGISYAADTAEAISKRFPNAKLYWLAGADMAASIPHWRGIGRLAETAEFAFFKRPQYAFGTADSGLIKAVEIPFEQADASSTAIRNAIAGGDSAPEWLDARVAEYIARNNLYTH